MANSLNRTYDRCHSLLAVKSEKRRSSYNTYKSIKEHCFQSTQGNTAIEQKINLQDTEAYRQDWNLQEGRDQLPQAWRGGIITFTVHLTSMRPVWSLKNTNPNPNSKNTSVQESL